MLAPWDGDLRINNAKELLSDLVDSLKPIKNLELAFRVYGHQYDKKYDNCKDTKLEVPFGPDNHEQIKAKLQDIKPKGVTPLAYSLEQAAYDFKDSKNSRNVIIIITDGLESCDGDPCKISLALQKNNIFLKPFVIGIGMDENFANQFACIGTFHDARDKDSFKKILQKVITQTLSKTKVRVDLLDIYDEPTETNVNMTFINRFTREAQYDFVHYKQPNGISEEVEIDPILTYNIIVNTIPPVIKMNIDLEGGKTNIIEIKTPQGQLQANMMGYQEYGPSLDLLVMKKGEILNKQQVGQEVKYLVGKYDVEVLTLPRTTFKGITIDQSKTTKLDIPRPGRLNIMEPINGYASLYEVKENGAEVWIYNFPIDAGKTNVAMQPGKYKIVYRSKDAHSNKFTKSQYFTITSGLTSNVKILKK